MKTKLNLKMNKTHSQAFLRLLMVLLVLPMAFVSAWANNNYKGQLTARCADTDTGKGRVYAAGSSSAPADASYVTPSVSTASKDADSAPKWDKYAHAKAVRGYKFDYWEDVTSSSWTSYRTLPNNMNVTPIKVVVTGYYDIFGTASEAEVAAHFSELTPYELNYKAVPGLYTIDYTYTRFNEDSLLETKAWESYSLSGASQNLSVQTYTADKVTLSTVIKDGFQGWYKEGQTAALNTSLSYSFNPTEANAGSVYYPKWNNATGNVASVNGVEYASLETAVDAANNSGDGSVTLTLLNYIFYTESVPLELTRSMTIDVNGKNLYGLAGSLFSVNGDGAVVTLQDGASTKGKILVVDANAGKFQAIEVKRGTFINSGAAIQVENKLAETDFTENTLSCAIYVHSEGAFTNTTGTLSCSSIANACCVYSQGATVVNGGTITSTVTTNKAYGIIATSGTTTISSGTISATAKIGACAVMTESSVEGSAASVTINGGTFNATASNRDAMGVRAADGITTINNGTFTIGATSYNAYGVVAGAESMKNREGNLNNGALIVNNGTFNVGTASKTVYSYGIYVQPSIANAELGTLGYVATTINDGKFKMIGKTIGGATNGASETLEIKGGFYSVNTFLGLNIPATHHSNALTSGTEYSAGYRYQVVEGAPEVQNAVCKIGETTFNTLEDAISYANNNPGETLTILMLKDYTLSQAGKYVIPEKTTLLVPKDAAQVEPTPVITRVLNSEDSSLPKKAYITLVLGKDVTLDVKGAIELGGQQNYYNNNGTGRPSGPSYGLMLMRTGSHILLEGGSHLYAWGFITGNGTVDARRGATVHEQFQVYDWEGGSEGLAMYGNSYDVFMINEYFIQNVEVPVTYRPGSALFGYTGLKDIIVNDVKLVGVDTDEAAMFLMNETDDSEDTWVRKSYDVSTDQQVYEINNSAKLGNLHIKYGSYTFKSEDYVLPVTNNMKIHLLSGNMSITQSTVLLPGAEIEIDKKSKVTIDPNKSLFLFDYHEWDAHIHQNKYAWRIECRPGELPTASIRDISSPKGLGHASMNIHGTFNAEGALYTTVSGANIFSNNEDAGQVMLTTDAPSGPETPLYVHKYAGQYYTRPTVPALLKNTDGSFAETVSTPAGQSYCYLNDRWRRMTVDSENSCFVYDQYGTYYAQAGEYIAINATKDPTTKIFSGNNDHTYSDAAGTGRLFILCDGCQWWEVENVDNLYHCVHPQNDTYYYWVSDVDEETGIDNGMWMEKKFAISWQNWDGSELYNQDNDVIIPDSLSYGVMPQYLHTPNPSREPDVDYTYTFDDWSPALSPVTKDQTYRATYTKEERRYLVVFKNGGTEVSRQFLKHNEIPVVPELTQDGKILSWDPMVSAVIGTQTYNAVWTDEPETDYDVQVVFKDYDGTILKKKDSEDNAQFDVTISISTGEGAISQAILDALPTPTKKQTDQVAAGNKEYNYVFDHWSPSVDEPVTQATVYTAVYREVAKTYTVNFYKEGSTNATKDVEGNLIVSRTGLIYGATPEIPTYNKVNTDEYTYTKDWVNMDNLDFDGEGNITTDEEYWLKSVSSVTGDADYVAVFKATKNRYTIIAKSEDVNGQLMAGCTFRGTGTYDYDSDNAITLTAIPNPGYEFVKWKDNNSTDPSRTIYATANATYIAVVREANVEVNLDESQTIARPTVVRNFVIHAENTENSEKSGQLVGAENITLVDGGQAFFDLKLDTWARHWNAFTVPFYVDLNNTSIVEVKAKGSDAEINRTLRMGYDYDIIYYNESTRATSGPGYQCWEYVVDNGKMLTPGQGYMIAFGRPIGAIRFTAKQDGDHKIQLGGNVSVTYTAPANSQDGGWNAIGNPMTYHALLNAGVTECQVHNGDTIGSDGYMPYLMNGKFVVGKAVFVKATAPQSVVINRATTQSAITPKSAPRRANEVEQGGDRYTVEIAHENGKLADRLFLLTDEEKEDQYEDLKDLPKAGISTVRAQMWVNRYGTKLCKNTIAMTDDQANYPLGIYAPKAGDYTIYVSTQPEAEQALYLTLDGEAIWNLSDGAYVINLEKGTTYRYGLRVSARAPQTATGTDEAIIDAHGETRKVLIDNQVYIIRGDKVYTIDGRIVK